MILIRQETLEKLGVIFIRFSDLDIKKNMNDVIRCLQVKSRRTERNDDISRPPGTLFKEGIDET
jgi:very-short-patch-repair endonuclease